MLIGVFNPSWVGRFHLVPGDSSSHPSIIKGETCQVSLPNVLNMVHILFCKVL